MAAAEELENPYPGLRPFQADETHLFFGRDEQTLELLRRLRRSRFLGIVGTSGSGKSSLVRAGLLQGLYGGFMAGGASQWRVVDLRPGTDPIANLAHALDQPGALTDSGCPPEESFTDATLRRSGLGLVQAVREARLDAGDRVVVLVDQFEELFRAMDADASARLGNDAPAFVKLLLEAASQEDLPIYVVLTMRSDFLGECARFPGLPEAISDGQYLIPRLTRDQRREAITGPAAVFGVSLSPTLVNRLLNDVGESPDQLPILQHALMRTWDLWKLDSERGQVIDLSDYERDEIGGMAKALSKHADAVLQSLASDRQLIAAHLFKSLATIGAGGREVRRFVQPQDVADLAGASVDEVIAVIEAFREPRNSFLMPTAAEPLTPTTSVDISHESLIRNWSTMRGWLAEESESARIYRRVVATAADYFNEQAALAALWRQPDLGVAMAWRKTQQPNPTWARRYQAADGEFIQAMNFLDDSNAATVARDDIKASRLRVWRATFAVGFVALMALATNWFGAEYERLSALGFEAERTRLEMTSLNEYLGKVYDRDATGNPDAWTLACAGLTDRWEFHADTRSILTSLCADGGDGHKDYEPLFHIVRMLDQGDFVGADEAVNLAPGRVAVPARRLMEAIADLQSPEIRSERCDLLQRAALKVKDLKPPSGCPPLPAVDAEWAHPVHAAIAERLETVLEPGGLDASTRSLLASYANPQGEEEEYVDDPGVEDAEVAPQWMLERMIAVAETPSRVTALIDNLRAYSLAFLFVMVWPAWRVWRWWQRRRGTLPLPQPSALRRAVADMFDVAIAVGAGMTVALTVESTLATLGATDYADLVPIGFVLSAMAYLIMCDAILFRHRRSLGKIAFDLRPVRSTANERGDFGFGVSAKRGVILFATTILWLFSVTWFESMYPDLEAYQMDGNLVLIGLALPVLHILLGRGRTLGDRWSQTRVIDADSHESLRLGAPPRYLSASPGRPDVGSLPGTRVASSLG